MLLLSKHQVVLAMAVITLTIPNSIQDSVNNTKAISRAKEINIVRESELNPGDSKEMTRTVLKMSRKVVLRKPKVKMTLPRNKRDGRKVPTKQNEQMTVPMKRMCGRKGQRNPWFQRIVEKSHVGKDGKLPKDIISIPMTVMSSGIRTIVRTLKQLVTVDGESKNKQVPGGPRCMQLCLRRGSLHPAQCHELC